MNHHLLTPTFTKLERLDLVKLSNGHRFIITGYHPNRPANCYSGVKERGTGKPYVFGPKHNPIKIGTVTENHPALEGNKTRTLNRNPHADTISTLVETILDTPEDTTNIHDLATQLRDLGY